MNSAFARRRQHLLALKAMRDGQAPQLSQASPCPKCGETVPRRDLVHARYVCPKCGHHYPVGAYYRLSLILDAGSFRELDERLTATGSAKHADHVIAIGDLKIYPEQMRVTVKGKEVKLANKEFELLRFLAENPNIVFSKDTLFDRIWGMDSLGDASTVTVHINRIREKIEEDSSNPRYIETVWGAGYRFRI